ncbi:MAG: hypothetical protein WC441_03395 [Patescibacteria group bacterium]
MPLSLHLFIHFSLALISGYLLGKYFKLVKIGLLAGFLGGFLIDLDHVFEYFFVFGFHFSLSRFLSGWQFLKSDTIYLIFHAWELVAALFLVALLLKAKHKIRVFILVLAAAMTVHLFSDVIINHYPWRFYSFIYRRQEDFLAHNLLSQAQWEENLKLKAELGL